MKFEVTDKREQREGLISKKTVYYCSARCELTDEEFAAIEEMAGIEEWAEQEIGLILSDGKHRITQTIRSWYDLHLKKTHGVWENGIRAKSMEEREFKISDMQDTARRAKELIEARMAFVANANDDVSIEI